MCLEISFSLNFWFDTRRFNNDSSIFKSSCFSDGYSAGKLLSGMEKELHTLPARAADRKHCYPRWRRRSLWLQPVSDTVSKCCLTAKRMTFPPCAFLRVLPVSLWVLCGHSSFSRPMGWIVNFEIVGEKRRESERWISWAPAWSWPTCPPCLRSINSE